MRQASGKGKVVENYPTSHATDASTASSDNIGAGGHDLHNAFNITFRAPVIRTVYVTQYALMMRLMIYLSHSCWGI